MNLIDDNTKHFCSKCGGIFKIQLYPGFTIKFCPHCGNSLLGAQK